MNLISKFFSKPFKKDEPEDVLSVSRVVGPLIDQLANSIFTTYSAELLAGPITYIVPAVWGATKEGELTAMQKEMNGKIAPVVDETIDSFGIRGMTGSQQFALGYLIRGLIISKIIYMIEVVRNQTARRDG
ncbi:MAG: hypothetical protein HQK57_15970 [Deltaproteobacteria bacterium]|nr:hypothetical protein [Deltaproteobacteria bacterium]